ncbi:uncharacterized protein LOC125531617 [Triticum urartu]|uniref:uncharacterized protein LOC125514531 n=1 Tax=Triticum urartu TaxID=4572 RepID=UPI002044B27B|nr:uncharacterized protein LOC125514531 [Triticum urartu]XP_048551907.1 uncharacterized protein LOC125531617 [Triticum urartu]
MAAASSMGDGSGLPRLLDNGLEFLLYPVDKEVVAGPDPLVMRGVVPADTTEAHSSCAVVVGHHGGAAERGNSGGVDNPVRGIDREGEPQRRRCGPEGLELAVHLRIEQFSLVESLRWKKRSEGSPSSNNHYC